jgi:hypothetical protein
MTLDLPLLKDIAAARNAMLADGKDKKRFLHDGILHMIYRYAEDGDGDGYPLYLEGEYRPRFWVTDDVLDAIERDAAATSG